MKSVILWTCALAVLTASNVFAAVTPEQCLLNYGAKVGKIERRWRKIHRIEAVAGMAVAAGAIAGSFVALPVTLIGMGADVGVTSALSLMYRRQVNAYLELYVAVKVNSAFAPFIAGGLGKADEQLGMPAGYSMSHLDGLRESNPAMLNYAFSAAEDTFARSAASAGFDRLGDLYERLSREKPLRHLKYGSFTPLDLSFLLQAAVQEGALCSPEGIPLSYREFRTWIFDRVRPSR